MTMTFGAYTACLQDRPLEEALDVLAGVGLTGAEINVGGFIPAPHAHVDLLLADAGARRRYLQTFAERGMVLAGLNTSGNPLSPLPNESLKHADDLRRAIRLAGELGVPEVVAMSGTPGSDPAAQRPSWFVNPWNGIDLESLAYQWSVLVPFWQEIDELARSCDVTVCWELHPRNVVFTPLTFERFVREAGTTHIAVNMDPSHLFWQQMDPLECVRRLGTHVRHVHAKDTRILPAAAYRSVLDPEFTAVPADAPDKTPVAIDRWCSAWPEDPAWRFVAVGEGHDVEWWTRFLTTCAQVNPDLVVNIEHEDAAFDRIEGLTLSARTLLEAGRAAGV